MIIDFLNDGIICKFDCGFEVKFGNPELTHEEIINKAKELHEEKCFFCKE